ncbi:MAG: DUF3783 domain-containing protein [Spirochaetes bacterium]|nr:DUF3783 domain-containing protein [Spirochaetota bacterium]
MADCALLFCGFSFEETEIVHQVLAAELNQEIDIFSAAAGSGIYINQVLDGLSPEYVSSDRRFIMFLGFEDAMISRALSVFPSEVRRPIFCGLTENNYNWSTEYLMQHLIEEEMNMKNTQ